jgi:hypothetical protein
MPLLEWELSRFNQNLNTPKKVCRQKEKGKDTNNYQSGKLNIEQHEPYHHQQMLF